MLPIPLALSPFTSAGLVPSGVAVSSTPAESTPAALAVLIVNVYSVPLASSPSDKVPIFLAISIGVAPPGEAPAPSHHPLALALAFVLGILS